MHVRWNMWVLLYVLACRLVRCTLSHANRRALSNALLILKVLNSIKLKVRKLWDLCKYLVLKWTKYNNMYEYVHRYLAWGSGSSVLMKNDGLKISETLSWSTLQISRKYINSRLFERISRLLVIICSSDIISRWLI